MGYVERIGRAVELIEKNLKNPIDIERVAYEACYSVYHFYRLFHVVVGETPGGYIRIRRLSESARELTASKRRIIDIAFDYQFQSQEAFTRSFKRLFGVTPHGYRKGRRLIYSTPRSKLTLQKLIHLNGGVSMEPKFVEKGKINLVGMIYYGDNKKWEIPQLWGRFQPKVPQVKNRTNPKIYYGLCFYEDDFNESGNFYYLAAVEVERLEDIPMGMVGKTLPANRYASFTHRGGVEKIRLTYEYIYGTWLSKSHYLNTSGYDFEFYDDRFKEDDDSSELEIMIPISKKE